MRARKSALTKNATASFAAKLTAAARWRSLRMTAVLVQWKVFLEREHLLMASVADAWQRRFMSEVFRLARFLAGTHRGPKRRVCITPPVVLPSAQWNEALQQPAACEGCAGIPLGCFSRALFPSFWSHGQGAWDLFGVFLVHQNSTKFVPLSRRWRILNGLHACQTQ